MSEKRARVFLGQLTKRAGSYGEFWSGRIGIAQMIASPSKDPTKLNVYLEETQQPADKPALKQNGFEDRMADDGIPF